MEHAPRPDDLENLEKRLRALPGEQPPPDLRYRIMTRIHRKNEQETGWRRLVDWLSPKTGGMIRWGGLAIGMAIAFGLGIQLDRLFVTGKPADREATAIEQLIDSTRDSEACYLLGRGLLAAGQPNEALAAFRRAEILDPDNPNYPLWRGAAYYAMGQRDAERKSYREALNRRPDFLPARINLANVLLEDRRLTEAEQIYEQVLQREPSDRTALYNRALILHMQGKKEEARQAWRRYLYHYRTGRAATRALSHLHQLGDFSFRAYQIGYRRIILDQDLLLGPPGPDRTREINYLARGLRRLNLNEINLVVFRENNGKQAHRTARELREELEKLLGDRQPGIIRISWFGEPETLNFAGRDIRLDNSVLIFGSLAPTNRKGATI